MRRWSGRFAAYFWLGLSMWPGCDRTEPKASVQWQALVSDCTNCAADAGPSSETSLALDNRTADGSLCSESDQCESGHCAAQDGVCCDIACSAPCTSCLERNTGYPDGICAAVFALGDPDGECDDEGALSCGANGQGCNGDPVFPACISYGANEECSGPVCSQGFVSGPRYCDGRGTCIPADFSTSCGAYACSADGTACLTTCAEDADCLAGYHCYEGGLCAPFLSGAETLWLRVWQSESVGEADPFAIQTDESGNAYVALYCGMQDVSEFPCSGGERMLDLVRFDASGATQWSYGVGDGSVVMRMSVLPNGETLVQSRDTSGGGGCCDLLTKLSTTGSPRWQRIFNSGGSIYQFDVDGRGNAYIHGAAPDWQTQDWGGGPLSGHVLVKYNSAAQFVWQRPFDEAFPLLDGDLDGELVIVTDAIGWSAFGCGAPSGEEGLYLTKLTSAGLCAFSRAISGAVGEHLLAVDATGQIVIAALVTGPIDFGSGPLHPIASQDLVLAKLDADGNELWSQRYPAESMYRIGLASAGEQVFLSGRFVDSVDFGAGPMLASAGASYIVRFDETGTVRGQFQFTATSFAMGADAKGDVIIASGSADLNFGNGPVFLPLGPASVVVGLAIAKLRF